ncbi:hypothetical protein YTPLAS18_19240 [Nitrospira sp.]|nr:hypothetical protein YTPLAS18_19240 [Nitrospira sp.]
MTSHHLSRKDRRVPLDCAVYYTNGRFHASGVLDNLSASGGCVQGTEPVCPGMRLRLLLVPLRHDGAIVVRDASVRWSTGAAFGIEIEELSLHSQMRLSQLMMKERCELFASSN